MGAAAAYLTWTGRSYRYLASLLVVLTATVYVLAATYIYVKFRYWLPIVFPVVGAHIVTHVMFLAYIVIFEQAERRRLRTVFTKVVSPDVVAELEGMEPGKLALSGARRNVTVLFADIRGFTEMTDMGREKAEDYIQEHHLTGEEAEKVRDAQARDTLATVNMYLTIVAEAVLKHKGTVDKFIGDCVMAFWGAPIANPKHALTCVRAAMDAQRAIHRLNLEREAENHRREGVNLLLAAEGKPLLPPLATLVLGSGINTGVVTVGLMGSEQMLNYTVFGRDVNLASRLESVSGRGRIIISEATLAEMIQDDPTLALSCKELPPEKVKGFRLPIKIYEVPWREAEAGAPQGDTGRIVSSEDHTGYFTAKDPGAR
jgi:adenylate cyclase